MEESTNHIILDSAALIQHEAKMLNLQSEYVTVPEVILEIRDSNARKRLETLPFQLKTREPSKEALEAVVLFSKKTGDFPVLSKTDLKVLALTYMIEVEVNDKKFVRSIPEAPKSLGNAKAKTASPSKTAASTSEVKPGFSWAKIASTSSTTTPIVVEVLDQEHMINEEEEEEEEEEEDDDNVEEFEMENVQGEEDQIKPEELQESLNHWPVLPPASKPLPKPWIDEDIIVHKKVEDGRDVSVASVINSIKDDVNSAAASISKKENIKSRILVGGASSSMWSGPAAGDDDIEWATEDNLSPLAGFGGLVIENKKSTEITKLKSKKSNVLEESTSSVACITGDFAMQNVLLQMRLRVISPEGRRITTIRNWVLKCDGCFKMCHDLTKKFCPFCGGSTLARLSYSIDKGGRLRYHYKKNRQVNTRGTKYAIPADSKQLLLREDQMYSGIWAQRIRQKTKTQSVFGDHVAESLGVSSNSASHSDSLNHIRVGFGSKNPNAMKGRERRGKTKKAESRF